MVVLNWELVQALIEDSTGSDCVNYPYLALKVTQENILSGILTINFKFDLTFYFILKIFLSYFIISGGN